MVGEGGGDAGTGGVVVPAGVSGNDTFWPAGVVGCPAGVAAGAAVLPGSFPVPPCRA